MVHDEGVSAALVVIDVQNDYFPGGNHPLVGPDEAAAVVAQLLERFRDRGEPVIHVRHQWDAPDAPYLKAGSPGGEIHDSVRPRDGEVVIDKAYPNAFLDTELGERLGVTGAERVVVVGMMTNMCIDASVREAVDRGIDTVLVADGCAASDLAYGGTKIDGATVHAAFLAALSDAGATVVTSEDLDSAL